MDTETNDLVVNDHYVYGSENIFAGNHYLVDMWEINYNDNKEYINDLLFRAAKAAKATVLHQYAHHFGKNQGIRRGLQKSTTNCEKLISDFFASRFTGSTNGNSCSPTATPQISAGRISICRFDDDIVWMDAKVCRYYLW